MALGGLFADHWPFLAAAGLLVAVGVWDDVFGVSPLVRFMVQSLAVLIFAVAGGVYLADLGEILPVVGVLSLGWMAIPFTVFAGVGAINAFNLSDGVDGLCGTLALVALAGLGVAAGMAGKTSELMLTVALIGGVARNVGFVKSLEEDLETELLIPEEPEYVGALGAALVATDQ